MQINHRAALALFRLPLARVSRLLFYSPSARTRRKFGNYILWVAGPLVAAAAVATMAAPAATNDTTPISPVESPFVDKSVGGEPEHCAAWSKMGYCAPTSEHIEYMRQNCEKTCAKAGGGPKGGPKPPDVGESGEAPPVDTWEKPSECNAWAGAGECKNNPAFMKTNCAGSCAALDWARERYERRCPRPAVYEQALPAGKMNETFSRIMSDFGHLEPEMISSDPPVLIFHKFLTDGESDAFIVHGKGRYTASLGVGMKADGTMGDVETEIRTSSHGWCQHAACLNDPHVQAVVARVADVTQTPSTNAEFAQLVYYHACDENDPKQKCAFYRRHSDYIEGDEHKLPGVRIYTLFAYLNDVPEGGGTRFTDLPTGPVTFQPQRGKAILWPSVLADQPHTKDDRTHHEALPVTGGEKYGANFWIHQYDFKGPHTTGCTAS